MIQATSVVRAECRAVARVLRRVKMASLLIMILALLTPSLSAEVMPGEWRSSPYALQEDGSLSAIGVCLPSYEYSTNAWLSLLTPTQRASAEFVNSPEFAFLGFVSNYIPSVVDVRFDEKTTDGVRWHVSGTIVTNAGDMQNVEETGVRMVFTNGHFKVMDTIQCNTIFDFARDLYPSWSPDSLTNTDVLCTQGMINVEVFPSQSNSLALWLRLSTNQYHRVDSILETEEQFAALVEIAMQNNVTNFAYWMFDTNEYPEIEISWDVAAKMMSTYQHPENVRMITQIEGPGYIQSLVSPSSETNLCHSKCVYFKRKGSAWKLVPYPYSVPEESLTTNSMSSGLARDLSRNRFLLSEDLRNAIICATLRTPPVLNFSCSGTIISDGTNCAVSVPVVASWAPSSVVTASVVAIGGTANEGTDFCFENRNLVYSPLQTVDVVKIRVLRSLAPGEERSVVLSMNSSSGGGCVVGDGGEHVVVIRNYNTPPIVSFRDRKSIVSATNIVVSVPVDLTWPPQTNISVRWADTGGGSASNGIDYVLSPTNPAEQMLVFTPGMTSTSILVNVLNHPVVMPQQKTVVLKLASADGASLGEEFLHGIVIEGASTNLHCDFDATSISISERFGRFDVGATLDRPASQNCTVTCTIGLSSTAISGIDFVLSTNVFVFSQGCSTSNIGIDVIDQNRTGSVKRLILQLERPEPYGHLWLGSKTNCSINITSGR